MAFKTKQTSNHAFLQLPPELFPNRKKQIIASVLTVLAIIIQIYLFYTLNTLPVAAAASL